MNKLPLFLTGEGAEETLTTLEKINDYILTKPFQAVLIGGAVVVGVVLLVKYFKKNSRRR